MPLASPGHRFFPVYEGVYRSNDAWEAFRTLVDVVKPYKPKVTGGIQIEGTPSNLKVKSINNKSGNFDLACTLALLDAASVAANGLLKITYRKDGLTRTKLAVVAGMLGIWHLFILVWVIGGMTAADFPTEVGVLSLGIVFLVLGLRIVVSILVDRRRNPFPRRLERDLIAEFNLTPIEMAHAVRRRQVSVDLYPNPMRQG